MVYKGVDPDYNPTGVYRHTFTLPADWLESLDGHDLYLRVGAVTSAMYVYVNGQEVGYSQVRTEGFELSSRKSETSRATSFQLGNRHAPPLTRRTPNSPLSLTSPSMRARAVG